MTPAALQQQILQNHEKAEADHKRLREDVNGLGGKVASVQTTVVALELRVQKLELTPVNADKVAFSGRLVVAVIGICLGLAGGLYQLHVGINDVQTTVANAAKIQDERTAAQKDKMDDLGRQIEMRRVEIQRISDKLTEYMQTKK